MRAEFTPDKLRRRALPALLVGLLAAALAGCGSWGFPGVYRINVEQGNIVTRDMLDQLKPGMTRRQVRYILGTPLVEDPFHQDRWEYLYMVRNGNDTIAETRLTVFFEGDALSRFVSSVPPSSEMEGAAEDSEEGDEAGDAA